MILPIRLVAAVAVVSVVAGAVGLWWAKDSDGEKAVSEQEAVSSLEEVFGSLKRDGPQTLCDGSAKTYCKELLAGDGALRAPAELPTVLQSRELPPAEGRAPARILLLCGQDGLGRNYESEFVVQRWDGDLQVPYPVFWVATRIASSPEPQLEDRMWQRTCAG